jgi:hypothetical protein
MRSNAAFAGLALFLTLLLSSFVQGSQAPIPQTSRLAGAVKDPSDAAMPSVDVLLIRDGKVLKTIKTNDLGLFSFDVPVGQYQLGVSAPDFKPWAQAIRVIPNMPALTITLSLEGITTTVDIVGNSNQIIIDAAQSLDATILTPADFQDLPDDEEDLLAYLQALAGGQGNAQIIIDGFEGGRLPRRDQIAQIVIEPNSFNATGTGPRITIVTREPGPRGPWNGNVNVSYRNSALNAANPHSKNKPANRRLTVGTRYSGPVIKGRLGMDINLSKEQFENGSNAIRAITPYGPVDRSFFNPSTYDSVGFSNNWYFSQTHTLNYNFNLNRQINQNQGIGNFTLEDRAFDSTSHNWNFQIGDNKTISPKLNNTLNFRMNRSTSRTRARTHAVAINVLDAFNSGGAQNRSDARNTNFYITDRLGWAPNPKLNFQFSINLNHQSIYNRAENNYLGTFTFSSLEDYEAGRALTFTQTSGNPVASFGQSDANIAVNMTYRISPTMSYSAGAQYAIQTHLKDYNNISPTMQYQVQLKKRHTISVGARLTYPNVAFPISQYEQLIRGDGTTRQFNTIISNPPYPDPFAEGTTGTTTGEGVSLQKRDPNLVAPYTFNTQIAFIEQLPKNWRIQTAFQLNRSVHQLRNRNVNAPYPGTALDPSLTPDEVNLLRPFYPYVGRINRFESIGNAFGKSLTFQVQIPSKKILATQFSGNFQTGFSWQEDDAQWQNPYDVRSDWARNDQRFRFQGTFSVRPPKVGTLNFNFNTTTGRTYSITTGKDDNLDQVFADRPFGTERNSLIGPGQYTVDFNWSSPAINIRKKEQPAVTPPTGAAGAPTSALSAQDQLIQSALQAGIPLATIQQLIMAQPNLIAAPGAAAPTSPQAPPSLLRPRLTFRVQVQNLLNNTRVNAYSGVITSPLYGTATSFGPGRSITFGMNTQF